MIRVKNIVWLLTFFMVTAVHGQVITSEKATLKLASFPLDNPKKNTEDLPQIEILYPTFNELSVFETSESEISFLGKVSDNGSVESVTLNSKFLNLSESGQFSSQIQLFPGENTIIVGALDNDKNYEVKRFLINCIPVKVSLAEKVQQESKYYALIIGINTYPDPQLMALENPVHDAQKLSDVLQAKYTFEEGNIQFLRDAKREEIIYALDNLTRYITPNDNLLIFYAGHGNFDDDANIGYWLPSNARKISSAEWFGNSQLVDYLKRIRSKHTLVITDACFSGSIFTTRAAFSDAPLAIEKLYELPSRKAMTSGTLTEVPDRSSFAKYLIDRLESNTVQYLSAQELFSKIRTAVINNSDAVPQYGEIKNVGDEGGEFIFIRKYP